MARGAEFGAIGVMEKSRQATEGNSADEKDNKANTHCPGGRAFRHDILPLDGLNTLAESEVCLAAMINSDTALPVYRTNIATRIIVNKLSKNPPIYDDLYQQADHYGKVIASIVLRFITLTEFICFLSVLNLFPNLKNHYRCLSMLGTTTN